MKRWLAGAGIAVLAVGIAAGAYVAGTRSGADHDPIGTQSAPPPGPTTTARPTVPPATIAPGKAPAEPPARVCGNQAILAGPTRAPARAVTVRPGQNLETLTDQRPAGTTFWLAPGVHKLGTGEYDQVKPKDGNTYLGAPGAVLDGQRRNQFAFTGTATRVTLRYLTIQNFGPRGSNNDEAVVNHDTASGWTIERSTIRQNAGSGVMAGSRTVLRSNCLAENGQSGFGTYHPAGVSDLIVEGNEIAGNNTDDWEQRRPGCGCTGGGKFWTVIGAVVRNNWVHDNRGVGLWADTNNSGFTFEGNYIAGNDSEGLIYETSYNAVIRRNTFHRNGHVEGPKNSGFPTGALYISESGADPRVKPGPGRTLEISENVFRDNWSGVVLWENADRFAGSPNDTSGVTTLVNPEVIKSDSCTESTIARPPYLDDCRWKTQNVQVHHNVFSLDADQLPASCSARTGCGYNGVFANWGTFPAWSPYKGDLVQRAITSQQNNRFYANAYQGPWSFVIPAQGTRANWSTWQGAPYGQDTDSVIMLPSTTPTGER